MSDHHLPEDLKAWPTNPYQVLGVPAGADERTLKRAYAKLIRHFKPEHHPEHFQRLREAYESAKAWRLPWASVYDESTSPADTVIFEESDAKDWKHSPGRVGSRDEWEAAWQQARQGEWEAGYAGLKDAVQRRPGDENLCLRLFWILHLQPRLDDRTPASWLVAGMRQTGLRGQLFPLYLEELQRDPALVREPSAADLLNLPEATERLGQLLAARVRALCQLENFTQAKAELDRMRKPLIADSPAAWIRVLSAILEEVVWLEFLHPEYQQREIARALFSNLDTEVTDEEIGLGFYENLAAEFATFEDMHLGMDYIFDRFELLNELRKSIHRLPDRQRGSLVKIAMWSVENAHDVDFRSSLFRELTQWAESPVEFLAGLDAIYRQAPQVVGQISEALVSFGYRAGQFSDPAATESAVLAMLPHWLCENYKAIRPQIVRFCVAEWITPAEIVRVVISETNPYANLQALGELANHIHTDVPLRVLIDGIRACDIASWS